MGKKKIDKNKIFHYTEHYKEKKNQNKKKNTIFFFFINDSPWKICTKKKKKKRKTRVIKTRKSWIIRGLLSIWSSTYLVNCSLLATLATRSRKKERKKWSIKFLPARYPVVTFFLKFRSVINNLIKFIK